MVLSKQWCPPPTPAEYFLNKVIATDFKHCYSGADTFRNFATRENGKNNMFHFRKGFNGGREGREQITLMAKIKDTYRTPWADHANAPSMLILSHDHLKWIVLSF